MFFALLQNNFICNAATFVIVELIIVKLPETVQTKFYFLSFTQFRIKVVLTSKNVESTCKFAVI